MKIEKLKSDYEKIVDRYIQFFCEKQELDFEFWVADMVGGMASFGDILLFNFDDIVYDINTEQPKGLILEWNSDNCETEYKSINYYSYSKGLRIEDLLY